MMRPSVTAKDMRFNPPRFAPADVAPIVAEQYGLAGEWQPLDGERDQNFRLSVDDGRKFVVKIAGPDESLDVADFQVQALLHLEQNSPTLPVPRLYRSISGELLSSISDQSGQPHILRIVTYLDGIPYGMGAFPNRTDLQKVGAFQGGVVNALKGFDHKASKHFMPWNLSNGIAVSPALWAKSPNDARRLAAPFIHRLGTEVLPQLNALPSQIIHNDGHSYNLLRPDATATEVVGLIDFGDMVHAPIINDLAVMATSFLRPLGDEFSPNDLQIIESLLIGFHQTHPLSDAEVSMLWDTITLRVIITILLSDIKLHSSTTPNPDVVGVRDRAFAKLQFIRSLDHANVVTRLRAAIGFD